MTQLNITLLLMIWICVKVIDVYATAQQHIDQGMSLTLFMRSEIPAGLYEWKQQPNKQRVI